MVDRKTYDQISKYQIKPKLSITLNLNEILHISGNNEIKINHKGKMKGDET